MPIRHRTLKSSKTQLTVDTMPEIYFEIPGEPVAKGRPKFTTRGGFARAYTPKNTADYEKLVSLCAVNSGMVPPTPLDCPITLFVMFVHARTQELLKTSKKGVYKHPTGRIPKTTKFDLSNEVKSVEDGLNDSGIWVDDSRIVRLTCEKWWAAIGEEPHAEVIISWR